MGAVGEERDGARLQGALDNLPRSSDVQMWFRTHQEVGVLREEMG